MIVLAIVIVDYYDSRLPDHVNSKFVWNASQFL